MGVPRFVRRMREARRLATALGIIEKLPVYDPTWSEQTQERWLGVVDLATGLVGASKKEEAPE